MPDSNNPSIPEDRGYVSPILFGVQMISADGSLLGNFTSQKHRVRDGLGFLRRGDVVQPGKWRKQEDDWGTRLIFTPAGIVPGRCVYFRGFATSSPRGGAASED